MEGMVESACVKGERGGGKGNGIVISQGTQWGGRGEVKGEEREGAGREV